MFTGIVQTTVNVAWVTHQGSFSRYALSFPPELLVNLNIGMSVSIDGICQTVVSIQGDIVEFNAIEETLARTTLKALVQNQYVNIERAAKFGDEIGGHLLSGHVIDTVTISNIVAPTPEQKIIYFDCPGHLMKYILHKGFIALNGVSLTVGEVDAKGRFSVNLIPETLRITTFGNAKEGDRVNLEIDSQTQAIVDTVERILSMKL